MKILNIFIVVFLSIFVFLMTTALTDTYDHTSGLSTSASTFTLSGTITNDHPDLSWNTVSGANEYLLKRLPVSATGYFSDEFALSGTTYLDQVVEVIEQTSGFFKLGMLLKHIVEAHYSTLVIL